MMVMMEKITLEQFKNKKVKITLSNNYIYRGVVVSFGEEYIVLDENRYIVISAIVAVEEEQ